MGVASAQARGRVWLVAVVNGRLTGRLILMIEILLTK